MAKKQRGGGGRAGGGGASGSKGDKPKHSMSTVGRTNNMNPHERSAATVRTIGRGGDWVSDMARDCTQRARGGNPVWPPGSGLAGVKRELTMRALFLRHA